jgi:hypothetical protein
MENRMAFMPQFAPFVVLLFLGSALAVMLAAAVFVYGLVRHAPRVRLWAALGALGILGCYAALLLGASITSRDRVLSSGEKKYFCEIDCHLAYSIERVVTAKALGPPNRAATASGMFHVVSLKTWFDESTVSSHRAREIPLYPNPRQVYVVDQDGRRFNPSETGQRAVADLGWSSTLLTRPLKVGESYVTQLVFDLPADIREPRLYVGDSGPITSLLIGHEESPLHRKIWFRI